MLMQKVLHLKDELAKKKPKLEGNFLVTEKIEGWYVKIHYKQELGVWLPPLSSSHRVIPSLRWTIELFHRLPQPREDCYIIAEAYIEETPFHILNGIFNRSIGNHSCLNVVFKAHDIIFPNKPELTAATRYTLLSSILTEGAVKNIQLLPIIYQGYYDKDIWQREFEIIANRGGEGIVAKRDTGIYSPAKRNSDLLKLKLECTVDLLAVRLERTVTEKGNLSLTLVSQRANGIEVHTVINKHEDQEKFIADSTTIIGKVVEIKAMEEFEDGQLRQAVFKCIRHDKTITEID